MSTPPPSVPSTTAPQPASLAAQEERLRIARELLDAGHLDAAELVLTPLAALLGVSLR